MSGFFHFITFSRFIHVVACICTSFLFITKWYSTVWIYHIHILFIHRHLGCFYFFAIMSNATINIHAEVSVWMYISISRGYTSRSGTAGPYGYSIFNFLRNCQTVFQSGTTYNPTAMYEGSNFSISLPTLVIFCLFVKWDLTVVLICISVMTNDVEHFFMYSLVILCILFGEMFT